MIFPRPSFFRGIFEFSAEEYNKLDQLSGIHPRDFYLSVRNKEAPGQEGMMTLLLTVPSAAQRVPPAVPTELLMLRVKD